MLKEVEKVTNKINLKKKKNSKSLDRSGKLLNRLSSVFHTLNQSTNMITLQLNANCRQFCFAQISKLKRYRTFYYNSSL